MYYRYCSDCEWWFNIDDNREPCTHPEFNIDIPGENTECPLGNEGKHRRKLGDQEEV